MKAATRHWLTQRLTAIPLAFLFLYFLSQTREIASANRMDFVNWLKQPLTAGAVALFVFCAFYHGSLGIDEIIEDYVPAEGKKSAAKFINRISFLVLGGASLYAVFSLSFGKP